MGLEMRFDLPHDLIGGTYANHVGVWHTAHEFTLDFSVMPTMPFLSGEDEQVVDAQVVARVRIPTSVIFEIARAISNNVSKYEEQYGELTPPPLS